jgi:hypothetical protein
VDSHLWEADLRAIRAGTAPHQDLAVRYCEVTPLSDLGEHPVGPEGWLEVYEDDAGTRPLVRIRVAPSLTLPNELHRADVVGWPAPGRSIALADGPVLPMGPAYPLLHPPHRTPWWFPGAVAVAVVVVSAIGIGLMAATNEGGGDGLWTATVLLLRAAPFVIGVGAWTSSRRRDRP